MSAVMPRGIVKLLLLALFLPISCCAAESPAAEGEKAKEKKAKGFHLQFKNYPSLRFGNALRLDIRAKAQLDFRGFSPEVQTKEGLADLRLARIGVDGKLGKHFEFQVEYELNEVLRPFEEDANKSTSDRWKDIYVNWSCYKAIQFKAGKFKLPFSMEMLTPITKIDFVQRSHIAGALAPGRDFGLEVHGRLFGRALNYEAGLFARDGENARYKDSPGAERTFAGRMTGNPLRPLNVPGFLKGLAVGGAFALSTVPEGPKGIRDKTAAGLYIFPMKGDLMAVHGQRLRLGSELNWTPGPFSLRGEFIHFRDERLGQSLHATDLPDLIARGWYASASWAVTGEQKEGGIQPRRSFLGEGGPGAIELAGRYEQIRFGSSEHPRVPLRNQRAANILPTSDRSLTLGVNWYLNRWLKLQFNAIRERIEDTVRGSIPGDGLLWSRILRLQAVM